MITTIKEYCEAIYIASLKSVLPYGVKPDPKEQAQFVLSLSTQMRSTYYDMGQPYGEGEENLLRYVKDNTIFNIED